MHRGARGGLVVLLIGLALLPSTLSNAQAATRVVEVVQIKGFIDPPVASYLRERIASAQSAAEQALIIELDSPGGLVQTVPKLVREMQSSSVPIVVWVAPRGAQAGGAATVLLGAADLAYMADETTLKSAVPVNLNSDPASQVGPTRAFLTSLISTRPGPFPSALVTPGGSLTVRAAERFGVIDGIASSLADVLKSMDGRRVSAGPSGGQATLETWDQARSRPSVGFRFDEMNVWARALHAVTSPGIAFLLLLVGAFGLIFEIYNPGIGLAAIIGIAALGGAFYALNILPTDWSGVLVIVAAIACFVVDLQLSGFGIWSAAGVAGVIGGGLLLFSGAPPEARLSPWTIAAGVVISLLFFVSVMTAALRVRLRRPITGEDAIVGTVGEATTDIAPEGTVVSKGKVWRARTMETGIASGSRVRIKATEGLVLLVEPLTEEDRPDALGAAEQPQRSS